MNGSKAKKSIEKEGWHCDKYHDDNTSSSKANNDVESTDKAAGSKKRHVPKAINTATKQLNESCSQKQ